MTLRYTFQVVLNWCPKLGLRIRAQEQSWVLLKMDHLESKPDLGLNTKVVDLVEIFKITYAYFKNLAVSDLKQSRFKNSIKLGFLQKLGTLAIGSMSLGAIRVRFEL